MTSSGNNPAWTIDRQSDRAVFRQLADILRDQITTGRYPPGAALPGEHQIASQYQIGREAVRQAIAALRTEGLLDTSRGSGTRVRAPIQRTHIPLGQHDRATVRMPTQAERHHHGIAEGVPLIEIHRADTTTELHPADRVELIYDAKP